MAAKLKIEKRGDEIKKKSSPLKLVSQSQPNFAEMFLPSKDHSTQVWLQLAQWFLRRRFLCEFPIRSYVKLSSAVGAIPNFAEMILGWSSSKTVSGISEHRPRWPPQPNLI
jgi:hypothetical protein